MDLESPERIEVGEVKAESGSGDLGAARLRAPPDGCVDRSMARGASG